MKQLTKSEFNKNGTTYKSVTSPASDTDFTQISDIGVKDDTFSYSVDGENFIKLKQEVVYVDDLRTIYQSPTALPSSADIGTVLATLINGEPPVTLYKYNGVSWVFVDQAKANTLYYSKQQKLIFTYKTSDPYFEPTSYTNTSQLTNGAAFVNAITMDSEINSAVGSEATLRSAADTALQASITALQNALNGKYEKPVGGIPATDLASAVQTSLSKADTALQSISSSDVTTALGYTPYNATNPNGYTKVESSTTNGNIKINGTETTVYTLPSNVATSSDITTVQNDINAVSGRVTTIEGKIPAQASSSNQLADKNFVNSSINAFAAYYITKNAAGDPFATKAELNATTTFYSGGVVRVPTTNDYCIVLADESKQSSTGVDPTTRYSYQGSQWEYQYTVNDTPLTAAQLAALNSGITSTLVTQITTNQTDIAGKQDKLTAGTGITISNNVISSTGVVTVDSALSTTSENPVQNKVITEAINTAQNTADGAVAKNTEQDTAIANAQSTAENALNVANGAVKTADLLNKVYPVGAIYMSVNDTTPASFLGGTWEQLEDRFLLGCGNTYIPGFTGGEATHKLTVNEMPAHTHKVLSNNYGNANANGFGNGSGVHGVSGVWTNGSETKKYYLKDNNDAGQQIIQNTGGGKAHNNMPPYLVVFMWKRTA